MANFTLSPCFTQMAEQLTVAVNYKALLNGKPNAAPEAAIDIEDIQSNVTAVSIGDVIGNPKFTKALPRKNLLGANAKEIDISVEDCQTRSKNTQNDTEVGCFGSILPVAIVKSTIVPLSSPKTPCKDTSDVFWKRYNRTAAINPSRILLLFATVSAMGSLILIYFALQSHKLAVFYS